MPRTYAAQPQRNPPAPSDGTFEGTLIYKLHCIEQLLRDSLYDREQEADFDVTYIVGGTLAAAAIGVIGPLPRTLKHVEIELAPSAVGQVALLQGNQTLAQAQAQHNLAATTAGGSNAVATSGGSKVTVRDFLDGSGYLTVLFVAAFTGFAQVRVRELDETQARGQRT